MSAPVISAKHLSKQYHLGEKLSHNTLRDQIAHSAKMLMSAFRGHDRKSTDTAETFWALKDVSFDIQEGEVIGVIGRNGAGKSTLLKILSQITEPSEGEVRIRGRVASLLEVGTGFHYELTGRENIFLNGAILGMSKSEIRRKFDEIVAFSEVEKFLDTPVKHYSSGMCMRLAFGVAAHLDPEILLVDEVLAVGDATFQQKCLGKMDEVAKTGRTVLFVSHNMAAMNALCDIGFYLENGRLKAQGPIDDMINRYMAETALDEKKNVFSIEQRTGSGMVRITNLEISPEATRITLGYKAERAGLPVQFLIGVFDSFNTRILALDSRVTDDLPQTLPAQGSVSLEFPEAFALAPGRYRINIAACVHKDTVDFIPGALSFHVPETDFFGTGRSAYGKAMVLCRTRWTLRP